MSKPTVATTLANAAPADSYLRSAAALHNVAVLRPETLDLCHQVLTAEASHFDAYCTVSDRRNQKLPPELLAVERAQRTGLHDAVQTLRAHCAENPQPARRERVTLMRLQVESDLALAARLRVVRGGEERQEIRAQANERSAALFELRDALSCGLGWPHRLEQVLVTAWIYDSAQPDGKFTYHGRAHYVSGHDTHNVSHIVRVKDLEINRGELHLAWEPHERWGNADPHGDIAMRLAAHPDHPLPHPLPRWPTESDVQGIDPRVRIAVGEQTSLL